MSVWSERGNGTVNDAAGRSSGGWGYRHGVLIFVGAVVVGIGLGLLLDDFVPWLLTGFGVGCILFGFVGVIGRKR